jgi:hypothetical protein
VSAVQAHRHHFIGDRVLGEVQRWEPGAVAEFVDVLTALSEDPFPGGRLPGVFELKAAGVAPSTYTVAFDHALLVYQVMSTAPVIKLVQVTKL